MRGGWFEKSKLQIYARLARLVFLDIKKEKSFFIKFNKASKAGRGVGGSDIISTFLQTWSSRLGQADDRSYLGESEREIERERRAEALDPECK